MCMINNTIIPLDTKNHLSFKHEIIHCMNIKLDQRACKIHFAKVNFYKTYTFFYTWKGRILWQNHLICMVSYLSLHSGIKIQNEFRQQ